MIRPHPDIAAGSLFRTLIRTPRPHIDTRISFKGRDYPVKVQALSGEEESEIFYEFDDHPEEVRPDLVACRCLYRMIVDEKWKSIFPSESWVLNNLEGYEAKIISAQILEEYQKISPNFMTCDYFAWDRKIQEGINRPGNFIKAVLLADCKSPNEFWGILPSEVIDVQYILWMSCRTYVKRIRESE